MGKIEAIHGLEDPAALRRTKTELMRERHRLFEELILARAPFSLNRAGGLPGLHPHLRRTREGRRLIRRQTIRERLNAKLRQVKATLRRMRHLPIPEQGRYLRLVLNGFYNYYAVPTNFRALNAFYYHVLWHWLRCLRRRSQRHRPTWRKMMRIAERWLPSPKLRQPYPDWRFDVMTRGRSPVR